MGDVYDFRTGRMVKRCFICHYWKDLEDFNFSAFGKYKRALRCRACSPEQLLAQGTTVSDSLPASTDNVDSIFEMEEDDDESA